MAAVKKKKKLRIFLIVLLVIVVLIVVLRLLIPPIGKEMFYSEEVSGRRTVESYYAFSGNVSAEDGVSVISDVSQKVLRVNYKVGDDVKSGDVIAVLDSSKIEESIEKLKINMTTSDLNDSFNIQSARQSYENALEGIENNTNPQLLSAQIQVDSAKRNLDNAKKDYNEAKSKVKDKDDSQLLSAQTAVEQAQRKVESAKKDYENDVEENDQNKNSSLNAAQQQVDSAKRRYDSAVEAYDDYKKDMKDNKVESVRQAKEAADAAADAYRDAKSALDSSENACERYARDGEEVPGWLLDEMIARDKIFTAAKEQKAVADRALESAKTASDKQLESLNEAVLNAKDSYDSALRTLEDAGKGAGKTTTNYYEIYLNAQENLENAQRNLADIESRLDKSLTTARENYDNAKKNYDDALKNQEATQVSVQQTLQTYKDNYDKVLQMSELSTTVYDMNSLLEQLEGCTIRASADGTISKLALAEGEYVAANQTAAVITDYSKLKITVKIDEYDIAKVNTGDEVEVYINATDGSLNGVIDKISPEAEIQGGVSYFKSEISFSGDGIVRPGMSAEVRLISKRAENVVSLSAEAVSTDDMNRAYVIVKDAEGKYENRYVTCGVSNGTYVEITEGLRENETVYYIPKRSYTLEELMGGGI